MRNNLSIKRQLKENVFKLREEGKSYKAIAKELGCSKGTINYHLSEGAAEKIKSRSGRREWRKVWRFCYETKKDENRVELFYMVEKIKIHTGEIEWV